jgi:succinate dehydrogenase / fumarate reductase, cytochrome b subunit
MAHALPWVSRPLVSPSDPDLEARAAVARRVRRAFSWTGVFPLGAFLVLHLALNAQALRGAPAFAAAVHATHRVPALPLVEALFVFAPLAFHGALGLWFVVTRTPLAPPAPYPPPLRIAMRATAVVALAFLAMHLSELRFHAYGVRLRGDELATVLDADLSSISLGVPWRGLGYLFATACVTFHFVCGLWGFFATSRSGRESTRRRRWAAWAAIAGGLAMWVQFADVVVLRATGAKLSGAETQEPVAPTSCSAEER